MAARSLRGLVVAVTVVGALVGWLPAASAQALPSVVPGAMTVVEGASGSRIVQLPVTLSEPSAVPVTVEWATAFGPGVSPPTPAEPGTDYEAASGTVTFAPGTTTATVEITVLGDPTPEPDEWIVVSFHHPTNAVMGGYWGLGFVVIDDDDSVPRLVPNPVANPTPVTEGDTGTRTLHLEVWLSNPYAQTATVDWRTFPIDVTDPPTATPGIDYLEASGTLVFEPGMTTATVEVEVVGDLDVEPDEFVLVSFSNPTNMTVGPLLNSISFGLIVDDDT